MKTKQLIDYIKRTHTKTGKLFEKDLDFLIGRVRREVRIKVQKKCAKFCRPRTVDEMLAEGQQDFTGIV